MIFTTEGREFKLLRLKLLNFAFKFVEFDIETTKSVKTFSIILNLITITFVNTFNVNEVAVQVNAKSLQMLLFIKFVMSTSQKIKMRWQMSRRKQNAAQLSLSRAANLRVMC